MSTWNYRVVHRRYEHANVVGGRVLADHPPVVDEYAMHEVYYDDDGAVKSMTVDPMAVVAEDVDGVRWVLERMQEALDKPVLEYDMTFAEESNDHDVA